MNILFLFVALPNLSDNNGLYSSLIHEFAQNGHTIFVSSRADGRGKTEIIIENNIPVLRIKSHQFTQVTNYYQKALAYQEYTIKQLYYIRKYWGKEKIDLIISHSLPPELSFVARRLKHHFHCKFYLLAADLVWQNAVSHGVMKKKEIVSLYYQYWERRLYKDAGYIGVPTKGTADFIRKEYSFIDNKTFSVVPFWQKSIEVKQEETLKKQLGLNGKFIAIYGGTIGPMQKLENLISLAYELRNNSTIVFLIVGNGSRLHYIKELVSARKLHNVIFNETMPYNEYIKLLAISDVGLVLLNENNTTPNYPAKTATYFSTQTPILAAIDYVSDIGRYLEETNTGLWCHSDDTEAFKECLMSLYNNSHLRDCIKKNQKYYFQKHMQPHNAYTSIVEQLKQ